MAQRPLPVLSSPLTSTLTACKFLVKRSQERCTCGLPQWESVSEEATLSSSRSPKAAAGPDNPEDLTRARERSEQSRIAALKRWGRSDGVAGTAPAREAFLSKFEVAADPDGTLPVAERSLRAQRLRRAHMRELALRSARARRTRTKTNETKTLQ